MIKNDKMLNICNLILKSLLESSWMITLKDKFQLIKNIF